MGFFTVSYIVLLGAALFHGLYGLRNILFELGPGAGGSRRRLNAGAGARRARRCSSSARGPRGPAGALAQDAVGGRRNDDDGTNQRDLPDPPVRSGHRAAARAGRTITHPLHARA